MNDFLKTMFIDQAKPALNRHSGTGSSGESGGSGDEEMVDMLQQLVDQKTNLNYLFYNYPGDDLSFLNGLDTSGAKNFVNAFNSSTNLKNLPRFDYSNCESLNGAFSLCTSIKNISLFLPKVIDCSSAFRRCNSLETVVLNGLKENSVKFGSAFVECSSLKTIDTDCVSTPANGLNSAFQGCKLLESVPLIQPYVATNYGQQMYYTFYDCESLKEIPAYNCVNISFPFTFTNCKSLENIWFTNIWHDLQVGSGTTWGHLLTLDSLLHLCQECVYMGSSRTLTVGSANLEKLTNIYVKLTDEPNNNLHSKLPMIQCESTDEGAMTITEYMAQKGWVLA